ncbi:helix-turn-helix domain-containing protein [Cupriavidus basilensis]|uniref:helix-turn-helix domain-containing protein n=1 Tax=Cupriavidus basilensis TaxID=68895 RepID=UPI000751954C|nr:helix-turn-helix domain-containing protein [Cupriavidus basilensis]
MKSTFGQRLEKALLDAKKDRHQLADELDISVQAVSQVIIGKTKALTAENTARAARFLQADWFWLATGIESAAAPARGEATERAWPFSLGRGEFDRLTDAQRTVLDRVISEFVRACIAAQDGWGEPPPSGVVSLEKKGKGKLHTG